MSLERLQCPNCGAPVRVGAKADIATCEYCGSTLRVKVGASGFPMATIMEMKEDMAYLAKEALYRRLRDRHEELVETEKATREAYERFLAERSPKGPGWISISLLFFGSMQVVGAVFARSWEMAVYGLLFMLPFILLYLGKVQYRSRFFAIKGGYNNQLLALAEERRALEEKLRALKAELDDLWQDS